jgi:hypothetical protein
MYRRWKGDVKEVHPEDQKRIRRHGIKFSRPGDLEPGFCASLCLLIELTVDTFPDI